MLFFCFSKADNVFALRHNCAAAKIQTLNPAQACLKKGFA
jgi:hypothetical protein